MKGELLRSEPYPFKYFKYSSHYWILKCLETVNRPLRILDVGTADGYLGAILRQKGHSIVGVEKNSILAAKAAPYYETLYVADAETFEFRFETKFDFVLFADVLEHLAEPSAVLKRSIGCLNEDGEVIVSVPNIANLAIRASLLFGRFDYRDQGILDRTHLHFYTLSSIRQLLQDNGLRVRECVGAPIPVQLVLPFTKHPVFEPLHELHYMMLRAWKGLMAYQFVLRAVPSRGVVRGLRES